MQVLGLRCSGFGSVRTSRLGRCWVGPKLQDDIDRPAGLALDLKPPLSAQQRPGWRGMSESGLVGTPTAGPSLRFGGRALSELVGASGVFRPQKL